MSEVLNNEEIQRFIQDGFIRIDNAFPETVAMHVRHILWNDLPVEESRPEQWTEPVIWLGMYSQQPFLDSVNSAILHRIFDQLAGQGNWLPCRSVGSFPVRFPVGSESNDTGIHVDASFPGDDPSNFFEWRVNVKSKGRALLMLVLYSDVSESDAPTVIYKGSHKEVARLLADKGDEGLSFTELADKVNNLPTRKAALATGKAGTIYLCHPFLAHSAQAHKGKTPKFMAQPPLLLRDEFNIIGANADDAPVAQAIRQALK